MSKEPKFDPGAESVRVGSSIRKPPEQHSIEAIAGVIPESSVLILNKLIGHHLTEGSRMELTYTEQGRLQHLCIDEGPERVIHILESLPLQKNEAKIRDAFIAYIKKNLMKPPGMPNPPISETRMRTAEASREDLEMIRDVLMSFFAKPDLLEDGALSSEAIIELSTVVDELKKRHLLPQTILSLEMNATRYGSRDLVDAVHEFVTDYDSFFGEATRRTATQDMIVRDKRDTDRIGTEMDLTG